MTDQQEWLDKLYWAWPSNSRKAHVFDGARSLCRKWGFLGHQQDQPQGISDAPGKDDCTPCWRKLKKLQGEN